MADWNVVRYDPNYEEKLDDEIIPLCDALNAAGFVTTSSCCGHGRGWPHVYFEHSTDERIENLARFVLKIESELGDYRPDFTIWRKEVLIQGYAWCLEIRLNDVYANTSPVVALEAAKMAMDRVTKAIESWTAMEA
jgi:hypothetical protein